MTKAQPRTLTAYQQAMQAKGEASRAAGADVICVAYDGIQEADWEDERKLAALEALVGIVKRAYPRTKAHDYKRRILGEHAKRLPADLVKAILASDAKTDKERAERHAAPKAKPTSKEKAMAAQPTADDADASDAPDAEAVIAVVKDVRKAEKQGVIPKGTAKATVKAARQTLRLAA